MAIKRPKAGESAAMKQNGPALRRDTPRILVVVKCRLHTGQIRLNGKLYILRGANYYRLSR